METNVNYTIVGAFVILLTAIIVVTVIWLSSGLSTQSYTYYKVYMREAVSGLSVGAPTEFNGVNVGTVSRIRINKANPQWVELLLKVSDDTPVTNGTRAKLDIRTLSGNSYIQLIDKGKDRRPLRVMPGRKYAVIPTIPSIIVQFNTVLTQVSESFRQISKQLNSLLDEENLNNFKISLDNMKNFSAILVKSGPQLDSFLQNAAKTTWILKSSTLPAADRAISNFENISSDFSKLSVEIKQNPAILIRGRAQPSLGPGEE